MQAHSDPAPIGHNQPPEPTLIERLGEVYSLEIDRAVRMADRANAAPAIIATDEQLAQIGEIGAEAGKIFKELDALREVEKKPFLEAGRAVDGYFKPALDRLERIKKAMTDRATVYQRAKAAAAREAREAAEREARERADAARREAEKAAAAGRADDAIADLEAAQAAEQQAAQARQAAAATSAADDTRLRAGETTITTRTEWAFEIADYDAIPLDKLRPYLDRAAVEKALRQFLKFSKGSSPLPGVKFFQQETAQFR
jgi:hypothetical protein